MRLPWGAARRRPPERLLDDGDLRRRTLEDHLANRWYAGETTRARVREIVLKALANPSYDASAFTTANTFRRWIPVFLKANWRACRGLLQDEIMEPFRAKLEEQQVEVRLGERVKHVEVDGDRLVRIETDRDALEDGDEVILAQPSPRLVAAVGRIREAAEALERNANEALLLHALLLDLPALH